MHHPVRARNEQLHRQVDGLRIGDHAFARLRRARAARAPRSARVISGSAFVGTDALRIVRQELRLDVGIDEEIAAQLVLAAESRARERYVELDLEGRRGEHQAAHAAARSRAPRSATSTAPTLCAEHRDVLDGDAVLRADVADEGVDVLDRGARSSGLSPRSPGERPWPRASQREHGEVGELELVDDVLRGGRSARGRDGTARRRAWVAPRRPPANAGRTTRRHRGW